MTTTLPFSTADCDESPRIRFVLGELILLFDYQSDSTKHHAQIIFNGAICMKFTADPFVCQEMLDAYSKVCQYDISDWVTECRKRAENSLCSDHRHFRIYFDHYGCLDVIAKHWTLNHPVECASS